MPELPEVETVRRELQTILSNQPQLIRIELLRKDLREVMPAKLLQAFVGERILKIERRAKYLLFWTELGAMISHLGMTGTWRVAPAGDERSHDHIYLHFENGLRLAYRDARRFGVFDVLLTDEKTHKKFLHLGPEPLDESFTGISLWQSLRNKQVALKAALMDQRIVVGVGNIYANEALFAAGVKPQLKAGRLTKPQAEKLVGEIKKILTLAIASGGSSISDFVHSSGQTGGFQETFRVYDRKNKECYVCQQILKSSVVGGRSTFWCSKCQK